MNLFYLVPLLVMFPISAYAEELIQSMEGSMDVKITYPEEVVVGRNFSVSVLVTNNGWENKQDISLVFSSQDNSIIPVASKEITIEKLAQGGSFGSSLDFTIQNNTTSGIHFLNVKYSQILIANNENPQAPVFQDLTIPISVIDEPEINIYTKTPESIFTNAEFPFEVRVTSSNIDIKDVTIKVITPKDIEFRGETMHTFSKIEKNNQVSFTSRIITPVEVKTEYKLPFEVIVEYTDDLEEDKTESKTVSLILRPRTFMELTTDGGIWIGDFFIAPYVSLGTIIGIPTGAIISVLIKRRMDKPRKRKRKKKL